MSYFKAVIKEKADRADYLLAEVSNCSSLLPSLDTIKNWKSGTMTMELQFISNFYTLGYSLKDMQCYTGFSTLNNLKHWISLFPPQKTHLPWPGCLRLILVSYRKVSNLCVQWAVECAKSMNKCKLEIFSLVLFYCSQHFSIKMCIQKRQRKKRSPQEIKNCCRVFLKIFLSIYILLLFTLILVLMVTPFTALGKWNTYCITEVLWNDHL